MSDFAIDKLHHILRSVVERDKLCFDPLYVKVLTGRIGERLICRILELIRFRGRFEIIHQAA